jgi:4-hydroxy-3-methylbut-2-enyl diphosphate reductase
MKVIRAAVLGYCMGVRRAMDMADGELRLVDPAPGSSGGNNAENSDRIYAMGSLIHNPQAMDGLKRRGLMVLEAENLPAEFRGAAVIIRAHGITPVLEESLTSRGARLIDATCPKVKASQLKARSLYEKGYRVFLAGERCHGEIIGIQGYAPLCILAADSGEASAAAEKLFREEPGAKTALIGQTTISPVEYEAITESIRRYYPRLEVLHTICGATEARQDSLRELCSQVEAVIVAGGRESANTRRLLTIARGYSGQGKPAWLVENPGEIPQKIYSYQTVGLCAGASTPGELIDAIEGALMKRAGCP